MKPIDINEDSDAEVDRCWKTRRAARELAEVCKEDFCNLNDRVLTTSINFNSFENRFILSIKKKLWKVLCCISPNNLLRRTLKGQSQYREGNILILNVFRHEIKYTEITVEDVIFFSNSVIPNPCTRYDVNAKNSEEKKIRFRWNIFYKRK